MTEAQARARLETMVAASSTPVLSSTEVTQLLALARRRDQYGTAPHQPRATATAYAAGDHAVPDPRNGYLYRCTTAGTTHATTTPTWPTATGATVTDGTVVWTQAGIDAWVPSYNLDAAAAEGWRVKAGKVAAEFNFATDGQRFDRSQQYAHCIKQADLYASRVVETIDVRGANTPANHDPVLDRVGA